MRAVYHDFFQPRGIVKWSSLNGRFDQTVVCRLRCVDFRSSVVMGRIKTASGSISGPVPAATGLQVHPSWFENDYSGRYRPEQIIALLTSVTGLVRIVFLSPPRDEKIPQSVSVQCSRTKTDLDAMEGDRG